MDDLIRKGALFLMNEKCYDNYFLDHNFLDVPCFKALLSKGLGIGIIAGSVLVKVPQVLKILNAKSGEGINLLGVMLDLLAITFHMSYSFMNGYPFSSWGDNTFLAIQTVAIAVLVLFFGGRRPHAVIFLLGYATILYVLNSGMTSMRVLLAIQSCNIPILLVGKLSQALTNYRAGSTGQLSAATVILMFAGSLARIFTSIQETGDQMIILTFCASTFANGVIFAQLLYYWNKPVAGKKDVGKVKKPMKSKKAD
ncbi:mannose-P-dolichol utilization defect 1 protein homolog [Drosophila grimshawi]|uniref:Mannose-P-dolichol utilization defect 1 protein homolog n=1 Tax=Drosophila grimshawi TaxID=7222 RepID=B4JR23_DROGR|nr:mannose-P-dolichol utilization defect 1 protein homolog [Drosophila grimshawi]EDV99353.1 GH13077 [Drosophila grimshawi]